MAAQANWADQSYYGFYDSKSSLGRPPMGTFAVNGLLPLFAPRRSQAA